MIGFIDDNRAAYGVEPICRVLPIAPSAYHARVAQRIDPAKALARARRDVGLRAEIRHVFEANFGVYGVRKLWRQLSREGVSVARCTVARLMPRWACVASFVAKKPGPRSLARRRVPPIG